MVQSRRAPLSRQRVLEAAIALADAEGLPALTMRRLGQSLGVEAMSLYKHVASKDALLDGVVDLLFAEMGDWNPAEPWRAAMTARAVAARRVFSRHPWALQVIESRATPGLATLRYHDAVLGCLRRSGFSIALAGHAFAALDSYVFGFAVQETTLPFRGAEETAAAARAFSQQIDFSELPHLAEMLAGHVMRPGYDFGNEFAFGLGLVLDGLERALRVEVENVG